MAKWMRRGGRMGRKKISIARISDERNRWAVKCHRIHCYCRFVIVSHFLDYKRTKESPFNCYQIITVIILCGKETIFDYWITRGKQPKLCNDWWLVGSCTGENFHIDNHRHWQSSHNLIKSKYWVDKTEENMSCQSFERYENIWRHMKTYGNSKGMLSHQYQNNVLVNQNPTQLNKTKDKIVQVSKQMSTQKECCTISTILTSMDSGFINI